MDPATVVYPLIKYGILTGLAFGFLILIIGSLLVHDTWYIEQNPQFFFSETLVMGLLSSLPILFISYLRQGTLVKTAMEFIIFFLKIVGIHLGFQLCGVYSILFPKSSGLLI